MADDAEISDALVVGGGLVGSALALALAREGLSVLLVEAGGPPSPLPRAYALAAGSRRLLANLGLWGRLDAGAQPILGIRVTDGRVGEAPSRLHVAFDGAEVEEDPMGHMVEERHLRPALADALAAQAGVRRVGGRVASQEAGLATAAATLEDGRRLRARLLVGADGAASGTAARAGLRRRGRPYGQAALTGTMRHERPHGGVAHQLFLPGGPLAILPLRGERSSLVWSLPSARAEALAASDDEGFLAALRPAWGDFLGALAPEGPRGAFPLALSVAESFVGPRVALAGDAARAVHPLAGQGLNAGLRDVAALADVLGEARARGEDVGAAEVLDRYARWRRFDSGLLIAATDGLDRLFSNDRGPLRLVRDLGLGLVGRVGPLRRALLREAAGLTGDLPRLMRP